MSPASANGALLELDRLEASSTHWPVATLIDDDTGEETHRSRSSLGGTGMISLFREHEVRLDHSGELVIIDRRARAVVFRSRNRDTYMKVGIDLVVTTGSFGLVSLPGALGEGALEAGFGGGALSAIGTLILKSRMALPDFLAL